MLIHGGQEVHLTSRMVLVYCSIAADQKEKSIPSPQLRSIYSKGIPPPKSSTRHSTKNPRKFQVGEI